MKCRFFVIIIISMFLFGASCDVMADDAPVDAEITDDLSVETEELIGQLASPSFIQRDWAARQLMSRGALIVPHLESAIRKEHTPEALLILLGRMSHSKDTDMASTALRAIASLRDSSEDLPVATSKAVEKVYNNSIRNCLAQLTLLGALVRRDENQRVSDLRVRSDEFGDRELTLLSPLTSLRTLDLRDTQITDAGLMHLGSMTNLVSLNLSDTNVTSSGLRELKPLSNLTELIAYRIKITSADRTWLREHLPGIRITNR